MHLLVQGKKFEVDDEILPKDGYLYVLHNTQVRTDMRGDYYVLDVDLKDFEEYYKFLQFRRDFELNEDFFDFMGHSNSLRYPLDFWKVKLIDDRIREMWYIKPQYNLIELTLDERYKSRVIEVMRKLPNGKLPKDHYIAGGAALYICGITNKFKDIDVFSCNKNITMKYIEDELPLYGVYYSGNALTYKSSCTVQFILREYSHPSQILYGFDIGSCAIMFDGERIWTTNKGLYCIENMVNWFEPDRSSPTYATRLSKYHMRGFMLQFPSINEVRINAKYILHMQERILRFWYNGPFYIYDIEVDISRDLVNVYLNIRSLIDTTKKYFAKELETVEDMLSDVTACVDPQNIVMALEDPENGNRTYGDIIYDVYNNVDSVRYVDLINTSSGYHDIKPFILKFALIHTSPDPLANPAAAVLFRLLPLEIKKLEIPSDPMSIMLLTAMFGYSPSRIAPNYKESDYETGIYKPLKQISDIKWYQDNPMNQDKLTGTFYPEPILDDVKDFYLSSPIVSMDGQHEYKSMKWYKKRYKYM